MFPNYTQDEILDDFILRFADSTLSLPEEKSFMEVMSCFPAVKHSARSGKAVSHMLKKIPGHKASVDFEQKMAAAFAIELEKEHKRRNNNSTSPEKSEVIG